MVGLRLQSLDFSMIIQTMNSSERSGDRSWFCDINLGIICPMANEEASAVQFVNAVLRECASTGFKSVTFYAILDQVSTDRTRELLNGLKEQTPQLQVIWSPENRTVADAYIRGYKQALSAGCDRILEIDAGFSHQPSDIPQFFDKMIQGYDCVFGSRFCAGGRVSDNSIRREIVSHGGSILANLFLGTKLKDMTSGFEMFSRAALCEVLNRGIRSRGPFFQTEIKAYCRNMKIVEVPIHYRADGNNATPQNLKDSFYNLWRLFRLRLRGQL
jgi:dolichol-phosphate mannosyltransferase